MNTTSDTFGSSSSHMLSFCVFTRASRKTPRSVNIRQHLRHLCAWKAFWHQCTELIKPYLAGYKEHLHVKWSKTLDVVQSILEMQCASFSFVSIHILIFCLLQFSLKTLSSIRGHQSQISDDAFLLLFCLERQTDHTESCYLPKRWVEGPSSHSFL